MPTDPPVVLGPFIGGLNQADEPLNLKDNELAICQNLDIGLRGELTQRAGLNLGTSNSVAAVVAGAGPSSQYLVGTVLLDTNVTRTYVYNQRDGYMYYQDGDPASTPYNRVNGWDPATVSAGQTRRVIQYNNKAWFVPIQFTLTGANTALCWHSTIAADGNLGSFALSPRGNGGTIFKDRMFIFGPSDITTYLPSSRIYYSASTDPTSWPGANFFDVNPGDGEGVTAIFPLQDSLLIFKRHSIYVLTYDTDPGLGTLRKINTGIGCTGPDAVTMKDGAVYFIEDQTVYRIVNYGVTEVGRQLGLRTRRATTTFGPTTQEFAYVLGNKIIFAIWLGASYAYYVYHSDIGVWSEYLYTEQPNRFARVINSAHVEDMVATGIGSYKIYKSQPFGLGPFSGALLSDYPTNLIPVKLRTKTFNFSDFTAFKRIFYWGAEMVVVQQTAPVASAVRMTAWHDDGTFVGRAVKDHQYGTTGFASAFYKAPAPKRSRWMHFQVDTTANTALNSYFKFFLISLFVKGKARVDTAIT